MTTTHALLVVAHGSRREAANDEFRHQVTAIGQALGDTCVRGAFLEMAAPGIGEALDELVTAGHDAVRVLPLFLNAGKHVSVDIPAELDAARTRHPQLRITLLAHLGASDALISLAASLGRESTQGADCTSSPAASSVAPASVSGT